MTDETIIPAEPAKPPLSDPRAEAAAEDAAAAALSAEPAPSPEPEPTAAEPEPATADATAEPKPEAKPKKTPQDVMRERIGHLTKLRAESDKRAAEAVARAEAAERLLAASGTETTTPAVTTDANGARTYTPAEIQAEAAKIAARQDFNRQANAVYEDGAKSHPDTWEISVANLNDMGVMTSALLEAAMATDAPAAVINFLGTDADEAARIVSLPPHRMGAELAKLGAKLSAPVKPKEKPVSAMPAPIRPISGAVTPEVDLGKIAASDDMDAYAAARKAQGSRWATGMNARKG